MFFRLLSLPCAIFTSSFLPGFGKPMQLLKTEVDRMQRLDAYVRDGFLAYRHRSYNADIVKS